MTLFALAIPLVQPAEAVHDTLTLNVSDDDADEVDTNALGTFHTLTAVTTDPAPHNAEIDFEIDCVGGCAGTTYEFASATGAVTTANAGGPVSAPDTPTDADQASGTADDTRTSPEMSCKILSGGTTCQVSYRRTVSSGSGDDLITSWIDIDTDNSTDNSDQTEGRDETTAQGSITDPDRTDVVAKTWFTAAAADIRLDCDDDDSVDTEINAPGVAELYTCFAYNRTGDDAPANDTPVSGLLIDAENLTGANDPDNSSAAGTADFNNACTTAADGKCTFSLAASELEVGIANVCFWIDEDNDNGFDLGGAEFDGSECDNAGVEWVGGFPAGTPTGDEYAPPATATVVNKTDPVQKTWQAPAATNLDATPERDSNVKGTAHTVSATVTDQFGGFVANSLVDFKLEAGSANLALGLICDDVPTNASGVATCTYTDSTTVVGPEPEMDQIEACVDADGNDVCDVGAAGDATTDTVSLNLSDQVEKFWFTTIPTAAELVLDAEATDNADVCETSDATADATATNVVEVEHEVCLTAYSDAAGLTALAGKQVTLTITGPGDFYEDSNDNDILDVGEVVLGKTRTVTTAANGQARADIYSTESGASTVTASADTLTDSITKTWTPGAARNIDCEPEEQDADPGTQAIVICTVTDRFSNLTNVPGDTSNAVLNVDFTETGPGFFIGAASVAVGTNGQAEARTETGENETGTQTITGELDDDTVDLPGGDTDTAADLDDPCDQPAGTTVATEPGGAGTGQDPAPAGNCEDATTVEWEVQPVTECDDGIDNDGSPNSGVPSVTV